MTERLVLCGGARRSEGESPLRLALSGASQNITLRLEDISRRLVLNVPDRLIDLIEIASYVYCADQAISRGGLQQRAMGADWRRDFRFVIPVRDPGHWSEPAVSVPLCAALSFLSEDDYAFEFEKADDPTPLQNYLEFGDEAGTTLSADEVVLFSGGLDSLSGAIEELATTSKGVALVSHRSSTKIFDHQKRLISALKKQFPQRLIHLPVRMTRLQDELPAPEHTHRSRSFLYAAIASVVARLLGSDQIRFFENGVLSINLPIAEQVVGSRATRTTHPLALQRFREFFTAALGKPIEIENPFIWSIKADVIRLIVDRGCADLIKDTVSCTRTRDMRREHTHCGCCSQCINRRFGVLAAGAACTFTVASDNTLSGACATMRPDLQIVAPPTGTIFLAPACAVTGALVFAAIAVDHGGGLVIAKSARFDLAGRVGNDTIVAAAVTRDADSVPTLRQITLVAVPRAQP
jgi:7-cyano-7-deazaguanine synthase in queuosine biosynthesis